MSAEEFAMDLLVRSRSRALSLADREHLAAELDRSQDLRSSLKTLDELNDEAQVQRGDDELLERLVDKVVRPGPTPRSRAPRARQKVAALFVGGVVLGSAGLAAASGQLASILAGVGQVIEQVWSVQPDNLGAAPVAAAPGSGHPGAQAHASADGAQPEGSPEAENTPDQADVADEAAPSAKEAPSADVRGAEVTRAARRAQSARLSPGETHSYTAAHARKAAAATAFGSANTARRAGDWNGAREQYEQIVRAFPGSGEAFVSMLSLGKLGLLEHQPASALKWFRQYQRGGGTMLAAEAMLGETQALEALGQTEQASQVRARLCRLYPDARYSVCNAR